MADAGGGADIFEFQASFDTAVAAVEQLLRTVEANIVLAKGVGDDLEVTRLEALKARSAGTATGASVGAVRDAPVIAEDTAALERENAVRRLGLGIEVDILDALKAQAEMRAEATVIIPAGTRAYADPGENLGAQVAAERELAEIQADMVGMIGKEGAGREAVLALELEQLEAVKALRDAQAATDALASSRAGLVGKAGHGSSGYGIGAEASYGAATAYGAGAEHGAAGTAVPKATRTALTSGEDWSASEAALMRYNLALGQYDALSEKAGEATAAQSAALRSVGIDELEASASTEALAANVTRLGLAEAEATNTMRTHGALTTEYLGALARGETTVSEFGYQLGATVGKFAGWTAAAAATMSVLGAAVEFGKGAIDTSTSVQELTRTIPDLNKAKASAALQGLSKDVNVPMKQAGDATLAFSRVFHNVTDAVTAARLALSAYKLDGVAVTASVSAMTAVHQQFGVSAQGLIPIFDQLAVGQREFNARVTDQIPLLLKSASAIRLMDGAYKSAGDSLHDLVVLSTVALRTTSLSGSQVGTALSRSAANFTNKNTTQGETDLGQLQALGVDTTHGYTTMLKSAIMRSASLSDNDRSEISKAMFGQLRGGLAAGLFTPGAAKLLPQVEQQETAKNAKGALSDELNKELHSTRQEIDAIVNSLQRMGAALAQSGALTGLGVILEGVVGGLQALGGVITEFDKLPGTAKEVISALVEMRLAMLFLSRTRMGASVADGVGLSAVNRKFGGRLGIGPSEETRARQSISAGNIPQIAAYDKSIAAQTTQANVLGREQFTLKQEQLEIARQIEAVDSQAATTETEIAAQNAERAGLMEEQAAISVRIKVAGAQQNALMAEVNAQEAAQAELKLQNKRFTTMNRNVRAPKDEVLAAQAKVDEGTYGASDTAEAKAAKSAVVEETASAERLAKAKAELAAVQERDTVATAEVATAEGRVAAAEAAAAESSIAADEATRVAAVAAVALEDAETGFFASMMGFAAALDPLLLGVLVLPLAFELLSNVGGDTNKALAKAQAAVKKPIGTFDDLVAHVNALKSLKGVEDLDAESPQKRYGWAPTIGAFRGVNPAAYPKPSASQRESDEAQQEELFRRTNARTNPNPHWIKQSTKVADAQETHDVKDFYAPAIKAIEEDGRNTTGSKQSRDRYYDQLRKTAAAFKAYAAVNPGEHADRDLKYAMDMLQQQWATTQAKLSAGFKVTNKNPFAQYVGVSNADIEKQVTYADDYSKAFGSQGGAGIERATYAYTELAHRLSSGGMNDSDLAKLSTAQSSLQSGITSTVSALTATAANAPTAGASEADYAKIEAIIKKMQAEQAAATLKILAEDKGNNRLIRLAKQAADAQAAFLQTTLEGVQSDASQAQQTTDTNATALAQAKVTGSSPEAGIQQLQIALTGAKKALSDAQASGAKPDVVGPLQTAVLTAQNQLSTTIASNALSVVQAQGSLASAAITGLGPAADLARAQQAVTTAKNVLAASGGLGEAAILNAQAGVDSAVYALNQEIQQAGQQLAQDAQAYIAARAGLAEAQTTDPVKQAQIALGADIQTLGTILRKNYDTERQYITAMTAQKTKVASDKTAVQSAINTQTEGTLDFEYATAQIGAQQEIDGLERILKQKKLSLADSQALREKIYNLQQGVGSSLDLNVGSIKLPSVYQVRRAIGLGKEGAIPGAASTVISHTSNINVYVADKGSAGKVGTAIDQALGTTVRAAMRAKGVG